MQMAMKQKVLMQLFKNISNIALATAFSFVGLFSFSTQAYAGTDLTATCPAFGTCSAAPASTPLLDEASWVPGSSVTQRFSVVNSSAQAGFVGVEADNYLEDKTLGEVIDVQIREGSPVGPVIYTGVDLHDFRDDAFFTIDAIAAGQTIDYYFIATMQPSAGNEYQAAFARFDLNLGLEITALPPTSGGGDGSGSTSNGDGSGGTATPPVCHDDVPGSAPSVSITNIGTNTVSLSWSAVTPVSHYALIFTRNSDGAQYGSTNIGNVTNFTINNLSGGAAYTFEVFGVNGCAPGPRGATGSGNVPGDFIDARPVGGDGQVLGDADDEASPDSEEDQSAEQTDQSEGQVAGIAGAACQPWKFYVPWILLVAQAAFVFVNEYFFKKDHGLSKHFVNIGITLASIFLFYLLRSCACYETNQVWILVFLCSWYWLVSVGLSFILRFLSYAFVEEVQVPTATPVKE